MKIQAPLILCLLLGSTVVVNAQKLEIKKISLGYRITELQPMGAGPFTVAPFLKDGNSFVQYVNSVPYNGYSNGGGNNGVPTGYLNLEIGGNGNAGFWKHYRLQAGVNVGSKVQISNGGLQNQTNSASLDTMYIKYYFFNRQYLLAGLNLGINRGFRLGNRLGFLVGANLQYSKAFSHQLGTVTDSVTSAQGYFSRTFGSGPSFKGANFGQWQVMIPLALEYEVWKKRLFARLELAPGVGITSFKGGRSESQEAHSAAIFLAYQLKP